MRSCLVVDPTRRLGYGEPVNRHELRLAANKAASLDRTPAGYDWHFAGGGKMQLVPADIHRRTGHDGPLPPPSTLPASPGRPPPAPAKQQMPDLGRLHISSPHPLDLGSLTAAQTELWSSLPPSYQRFLRASNGGLVNGGAGGLCFYTGIPYCEGESLTVCESQVDEVEEFLGFTPPRRNSRICRATWKQQRPHMTGRDFSRSEFLQSPIAVEVHSYASRFCRMISGRFTSGTTIGIILGVRIFSRAESWLPSAGFLTLRRFKPIQTILVAGTLRMRLTAPFSFGSPAILTPG
jgi:hypothetical protein